jgi:hypothetical protein
LEKPLEDFDVGFVDLFVFRQVVILSLLCMLIVAIGSQLRLKP